LKAEPFENLFESFSVSLVGALLPALDKVFVSLELSLIWTSIPLQNRLLQFLYFPAGNILLLDPLKQRNKTLEL